MKKDRDGEKGEDMDVRQVHGALWRELAEPMELFRQTPWYIKHTFLLLCWLAIIYLFMQRFDWNEYEEDPLRRYLRDATPTAVSGNEAGPAAE